MSSASVSSGLVGVAFLPHGCMVLDPARPDLPASALALHAHCASISARIAALKPSLLLLSTPHGLSLHQSAAVYQPYTPSACAEGSCEWKQQWAEYGVRVRLDGEESGRLLQHLRRRQADGEGGGEKQQAERLPVQALLSFAGLSTPLRWGEAVPLHIALHDIVRQQQQQLQQQQQQTTAAAASSASAAAAAPLRFLDAAASSSCPSVIILSQPRLGLTAAERAAFRPRLPQLLYQLGRDVREHLTSAAQLQQQRVVVVISGDLAHCHPWGDSTTAIYTPDSSAFATFPREGRAEAAVFDAAVRRWITGGGKAQQWRLDSAIIADEAGGVEERALSCGYTGLLMLQGLLDADTLAMAEAGTDDGSAAAAAGSSSDWLLSDFTLQVPTYYGMMTAMLTRNESAAR